MFRTLVSGRGRGRSRTPHITLHQQLQHRVNMSNQWTCSLLFNKALSGSKEPILPSHYVGKEFERKNVLELKLASLQAGFVLSICSSKTLPANSAFERYLLLGCNRSYLYRPDHSIRVQQILPQPFPLPTEKKLLVN